MTRRHPLTRVDRLAGFGHLICRPSRGSGGGDAHGKKRASHTVAETEALHLTVRVHVDQAREERHAASLNHLGILGPDSASRDKRAHPIARDDDVSFSIARPQTVPYTGVVDYQSTVWFGESPGH